MNRLFLDANVLFSAAYSAKSGLLVFWKLKNVALLSSRHALEEARTNLEEEAQRLRLDTLAKKLQFFEAATAELPKNILLPEKDVPIFLAAIEGRATHLITGDLRHFGSYFGKVVEGILILPPSGYLKRFTGLSS